MASPLQNFVLDLTFIGLITPEELKQFLGAATEGRSLEDAEALAQSLIRQNRLTEFQAAALIKGRPGDLLIENYLVLERLGSGGMGTVYKAEHRRLKRIVALKVLDRSTLLTPRDVQRFHREVEAVAKLSHPNIVAALDAGEETGTHFLVMEYVNGRDLSQLVKAEGPLALSRTLNYILQAARGLEAAHLSGIIHRDIKPANLLLDEAGTVKLLDLGLARFDSGRDDEEEEANTGLTQTGMIMGTADYMSPEQALDTHRADLRADIYSLGCTLHFLLMGRPVYGGNTVMKKIFAHREQPIPSLRAIRPDLPAALDAIFEKMVAKTPEGRYQSMSEVIRALEYCQRQLPQSAGQAPGLVASGDDDLVSINLTPVDTINVQDEPRSSTITTASQIRARGRKQRTPVVPLAIGGVAFVLIVAGILLSLGGGKPQTGGGPLPSGSKTATKAGSPKTKGSKSGTAKVAIAKLPPLGWGEPVAALPGLALDPPVLPGLGRWQVVTAAPTSISHPVDWSPDGTRVVVGGEMGQLRIYRVKDWRLLSVMPSKVQHIYCATWSPDGSRIAVAGTNGIVELWHGDGAPGRVLEGLHHHTGIRWSPNGEWLALHSNDVLGLWTADGKLMKTFPPEDGAAHDVAWSPDGTQLVSNRGRRLNIVNVDGSAAKNPISFVHPNDLHWVAWGAQGQIAAIDSQGVAYVHPVQRADPVTLNLGIGGMEFSPDGTQLAFGLHNAVEVYTADGKPTEARHYTSSARGVAWSPDGKQIAWAGWNLGVWEPWGVVSQLPSGFNSNRFDLQPEGQAVTIDANHGLRWWSANGAVKRFEALPEGLNHIKWSPDSKKLGVSFFGDLALSVNGGPLQVQIHQQHVEGMCWSADGKQLAIPFERGAKILDLDGNVLHKVDGHAEYVQMLDWSRTGQLATSDNLDVRLWNADGTPGPTVDFQDPLPAEDRNRRVNCLKWSPDGQVLALGLCIGENLRLFDTQGKPLATFPEPSWPNLLAWSPDGKQIAMANDGIRMWNTDGTVGKFLPGSTWVARGLGWSLNDRIVALDGDGLVRCWDGSSHQLQWVGIAVPGGGTATIDPLGNVTDSTREPVDQVLSYLVEREHGRLEAITPEEFQKLRQR